MQKSVKSSSKSEKPSSDILLKKKSGNIDGIQSGPKRVISKPDRLVKNSPSIKSSKGNYMKPTEAFLNSVQTPNNKDKLATSPFLHVPSPKSISTLATPVSNFKFHEVSQAQSSSKTPNQYFGDEGMNTPNRLNMHQQAVLSAYPSARSNNHNQFWQSSPQKNLKSSSSQSNNPQDFQTVVRGHLPNTITRDQNSTQTPPLSYMKGTQLFSTPTRDGHSQKESQPKDLRPITSDILGNPRTPVRGQNSTPQRTLLRTPERGSGSIVSKSPRLSSATKAQQFSQKAGSSVKRPSSASAATVRSRGRRNDTSHTPAVAMRVKDDTDIDGLKGDRKIHHQAQAELLAGSPLFHDHLSIQQQNHRTYRSPRPSSAPSNFRRATTTSVMETTQEVKKDKPIPTPPRRTPSVFDRLAMPKATHPDAPPPPPHQAIKQAKRAVTKPATSKPLQDNKRGAGRRRSSMKARSTKVNTEASTIRRAPSQISVISRSSGSSHDLDSGSETLSIRAESAAAEEKSEDLINLSPDREPTQHSHAHSLAPSMSPSWSMSLSYSNENENYLGLDKQQRQEVPGLCEGGEEEPSEISLAASLSSQWSLAPPPPPPGPMSFFASTPLQTPANTKSLPLTPHKPRTALLGDSKIGLSSPNMHATRGPVSAKSTLPKLSQGERFGLGQSRSDDGLCMSPVKPVDTVSFIDCTFDSQSASVRSSCNLDGLLNSASNYGMVVNTGYGSSHDISNITAATSHTILTTNSDRPHHQPSIGSNDATIFTTESHYINPRSTYSITLDLDTLPRTDSATVLAESYGTESERPSLNNARMDIRVDSNSFRSFDTGSPTLPGLHRMDSMSSVWSQRSELNDALFYSEAPSLSSQSCQLSPIFPHSSTSNSMLPVTLNQHRTGLETIGDGTYTRSLSPSSQASAFNTYESGNLENTESKSSLYVAGNMWSQSSVSSTSIALLNPLDQAVIMSRAVSLDSVHHDEQQSSGSDNVLFGSDSGMGLNAYNGEEESSLEDLLGNSLDEQPRANSFVMSLSVSSIHVTGASRLPGQKSLNTPSPSGSRIRQRDSIRAVTDVPSSLITPTSSPLIGPGDNSGSGLASDETISTNVSSSEAELVLVTPHEKHREEVEVKGYDSVLLRDLDDPVARQLIGGDATTNVSYEDDDSQDYFNRLST